MVGPVKKTYLATLGRKERSLLLGKRWTVRTSHRHTERGRTEIMKEGTLKLSIDKVQVIFPSESMV